MTRPGIELQSPGPLANTLPLGQWSGTKHYLALFIIELCSIETRLPIILNL